MDDYFGNPCCESFKPRSNPQSLRKHSHGMFKVTAVVERLRFDPNCLQTKRIHPQDSLSRPLRQVKVPNLGQTEGLGGHDKVANVLGVTLLHVGIQGEAEVQQGVGIVLVAGEVLGLPVVDARVV